MPTFTTHVPRVFQALAFALLALAWIGPVRPVEAQEGSLQLAWRAPGENGRLPAPPRVALPGETLDPTQLPVDDLVVPTTSAAYSYPALPGYQTAALPQWLEPPPLATGHSPLATHLSLDPAPGESRVIQASTGGMLEDQLVEPLENLSRPELSAYKQHFIQKAQFTATWLPLGQVDELDLETYASLAIPLPLADMAILVTPGFAARFLNGSGDYEVPGTLYDMYVEFRYLGMITKSWGLDIAVAPGWYTDSLDEINAQSFRLTGRALASYEWVPQRLKMILGIIYLDRDDVNWLPAAGLIYTPDDTVKWELVFPRPRYARLMRWNAWSEDWLYATAEFGGGSWFVQPTPGASDTLTLADYRAILGYERLRDGGGGWRLELGYVFGRSMEYASSSETLWIDSTIMARGAVTY